MMPIKVQCPCGQRFAFDAEPVNGCLTSPVACPVCGADGTAAANEQIALLLAASPEPAPVGGAKLRMATPSAPASPAIPPPLPPTRIQPVATVNPPMAWYEQVWIALPIALVAFGGAIGGACGGAAWAVNRAVFKKTANPVLRYVWTGLISASAVVLYLLIALLLISMFHKLKNPAQ